MPLSPTQPTDTAYWEERHQAKPGQLAAVGHRKLSEDENRLAYLEVSQVLRGALHAVKPAPQASLLDVGCGIGYFFPLFREFKLLPEGIDLSATAVQVAQANNPGVRVRTMRVHELQKEHYAIVTAMDVLYHITSDAEWELSLAAIARLTSPGGHVILHETFAEDAKHLSPVPHICFRSQAAYRKVLAANGLTVLEVVRYHSRHGAVKSLLTAIRA